MGIFGAKMMIFQWLNLVRPQENKRKEKEKEKENKRQERTTLNIGHLSPPSFVNFFLLA